MLMPSNSLHPWSHDWRTWRKQKKAAKKKSKQKKGKEVVLTSINEPVSSLFDGAKQRGLADEARDPMDDPLEHLAIIGRLAGKR